MKNKISAIVPIFNAEIYLEKCIESIILQSHKNIEIILVNDGSTDKSPQICDLYEQKDSRIKVIHKANTGRSDARNEGLRVASGDFCMFIDSDDWIEKTMAEHLLSFALDNNADVVISTISNENEFKNEIQYLPWSGERKFLGKDIINELLPHIISSIDTSGKKIIPISGSVCRCFYSTNILKNNNIFFNEKLSSGEDKEFNLRVLTKCTSVYTTNNCYYHYNRSISHGGSTTQRYAINLYEKAKYRQDCYKKTLEDAGVLEIFKKPLNLIWVSTVISVVKNLCYPGSPYSLIQIIKQSNNIIDDSKLLKIIELFNSEQLEIISKKDINLVCNHLPFFIIKTIIIIYFKRIIVKIRKLLRK